MKLSGDNITRGAEVSPCGRYRWWLTRTWPGGNGQRVCFIMLNPSTADAYKDDPTIRRCIEFAMSWKMSGLIVRNLLPYRATSPKVFRLIDYVTARSPCGRGEAELLKCNDERLVVAAWGQKVGTYIPDSSWQN